MTIALCLICGGVMNAQKLTVSGTVTDATTGETLIGAYVLQEGTQNGTMTDIDGKYTIEVPSGATLQFALVGYKSLNLVAATSILNAALQVDAEFLDESVVVGYTVQKKRDVLGAVGKVGGDKLTAVPVSSVQQSLQGRISGVQVSTQTGAPGAAISVRVRGTSSISSSNSPLYIVDGIPVEGALENLSTTDIESMTVLKDASSAAIYGSRASNGVVLITTKSGKSGDAKINYNMQTGIQFHGHLTEMCNTAEYIELYNEATRADNASSSAVSRKLIEGEWVKDFADVNHLEEIFRIAPINQHELGISGGNDKTQYILTGSYYDQQGIIYGTDYNRVNLRSNVSSQVKDWLKVSLNVNASYSNNRAVSSSGDGYVSEGGSVVRYALFRNPAIPVRDANGDYVDTPAVYYGDPVYNTFFGDGYSPEGLTEYTDRTTKTKSLLATGNVLINFSKDIFLNTTAGIDYRNSTLRVFNPTWGDAGRINATNNLDLSIGEEMNWTVNSTFNHHLNFGEHRINYLLGAEAVHNSSTSYGLSDTNFDDVDPDMLFVGLGTKGNQCSQGYGASSLLSFFANVNYNFNSKYYLSAILREDGSSRFSKGNRWGTFYSVSAGWNMEEEEFLRDAAWLNKLKIRAGYGSIGNQNIGLYAYSDRYSNHYWYAFGGEAYNGYVQTALGNENLKWETSNQANFGIDMEVLDNTLGGTIDLYYKVTKDMLVQESLPLSVGNTSAPWINNGSVLNAGVDLELFYRRSFADWGFDITFNGGYLYNEVLALNAPILSGRVDTGIYATRTEVGYPIGSFFLYKTDGIFQNEMDVITSAYQGQGVKPGDVKYVDVVEDGVIDANDRTYCGSAMPKFTAGLNLSAYWKNFDFSAFFQGAFGQKIFSQVNYDIEGFYRGFNVTKRYYDERWTGEGTSNTQPRAAWGAKTNNVKVSDRFLEDGSYLRLKNLQLGYRIKTPESWKVSNLRVYIAASNLFTITAYNGLDPEMTVSTNSAAEGDRANGIDWGTYPVAKSVTAGINLTF